MDGRSGATAGLQLLGRKVSNCCADEDEMLWKRCKDCPGTRGTKAAMELKEYRIKPLSPQERQLLDPIVTLLLESDPPGAVDRDLGNACGMHSGRSADISPQAGHGSRRHVARREGTHFAVSPN